MDFIRGASRNQVVGREDQDFAGAESQVSGLKSRDAGEWSEAGFLDGQGRPRDGDASQLNGCLLQRADGGR